MNGDVFIMNYVYLTPNTVFNASVESRISVKKVLNKNKTRCAVFYRSELHDKYE